MNNNGLEDTEPALIYFLAQVGHEIRTPLNAVKGFSDLLLEEAVGPLNEKQKFYLQKIEDGSEQLLRIVNQILDWAKLQSGQMELQREAVDVLFLAKEIEALVDLQMQQRKLLFSVTGEPLLIHGDHGRLREILLNLVNNAMKFTDAGGRISIDVSPYEGNQVRITVRDTGIGMSPVLEAKLFQPFMKGVNRPGEEKSTGLGLWICKSLTELQQGTIQVESEENVGTAFYLTFPLYHEEKEVVE